jgi:pectate lyase
MRWPIAEQHQQRANDMQCRSASGGNPSPRRAIAAVAALLVSCSASGQGQQATPTIVPPDPRPAAAPGFAGAVGFGAKSQGGRGGRIMRVTTLADAGPGSLRACIEAKGPRVCVFAVSGVIRFTARPPVIANPYITIAGQTAPGGGITLAHAGAVGGRTPLVIKGTHDVIVRHLRIRNDRLGEERGAEDSVTIENSSFVIIDQVSASWARDELINGYADNDHVTISNSVFAYALPRHDKCALLASDPGDAQHFSFIANLCAHSGDRNPDVNFPKGSCVEVVNNVFYNAQSEFAEVWESHGGTPVSLVGNSFVAGPNTGKAAVGIVRQTVGSTGPASIYQTGNAFQGNFVHLAPSLKGYERGTPPCRLTVTPLAASLAYQHVLERAGAWPRDAIDARAVSEVRSRKGRITARPGAIPPVRSAASYLDRDGDGMDDGWEAKSGMNPAAPDPWADTDRDGLANLDEFLAAIDKTPRGRP